GVRARWVKRRTGEAGPQCSANQDVLTGFITIVQTRVYLIVGGSRTFNRNTVIEAHGVGFAELEVIVVNSKVSGGGKFCFIPTGARDQMLIVGESEFSHQISCCRVFSQYVIPEDTLQPLANIFCGDNAGNLGQLIGCTI